MELHSKYRHLLRDYTVPSPLLPIVEDMVKSILKEREEYQVNEATELKARKTNLLNLLKQVMLRYGKGEIKTDVYEATREDIDRELADIDAVLEKEIAKNLTWTNSLGRPR